MYLYSFFVLFNIPLSGTNIANLRFFSLYFSFVYLTVTLGIASTASIRISNLLAVGNLVTARLTARGTLLIGILIASISAAVTYFLCTFLAQLFTSDVDVRFRAVNLAPWAAAFQWAISVLGCLQGVLRGLGHQYFMAK